MAQQPKTEVVADSSPVSTLSDPYVSINGVYGEFQVKESVITNVDGKLTVTMGKRPTASGTYCAPPIVGSGSVTFPDVNQTIAYTFDGTKISWSNNTQWTKRTIDGSWIDESNNEISVKADSDGELEITWITGGRPVSYGNINVITNKGYVRFIDDAKIALVLNGDSISWNNKTVWKRK